MPLLAIGLLLLSALLHTTWNLLLKGAGDKFIASWWTALIGAILAVVLLGFTGLPPRPMWGFVFFSVLVEAAYFITLSYAYRDHDFSLVYPLARGAAPAFLVIWSLVFLGERITSGGMLGLGLIVGGLTIIGTGPLWAAQGRHVHLKGIALGLAVAVCISLYTAIDGTAVKRGYTLAYAFAVFSLIPLPLTPFILIRYPRRELAGAWRQQRLRLLAIGLLGVASYLLALAAYSFAPLSYSGSVREVSVVLGAFAGWHFLGEKLGRLRLVGAAIIFAGILAIGLWG